MPLHAAPSLAHAPLQSPLYALNGIWPATGPAPPAEDVIGGVSTIVWSLTLIPLVKYVSLLAAAAVLRPV